VAKAAMWLYRSIDRNLTIICSLRLAGAVSSFTFESEAEKITYVCAQTVGVTR
jgi:hypothetical protein